MKYILTFIAAFLLIVSLRAESIEGEIKINFSKSSFGPDVFKKEFGGKVKAGCRWYAGKFMDRDVVFAGITVNNTADKPMTVHYYVAFFDKDKKLVASTGQGSFSDKGLKPGEKTQFGSCIMDLPAGKYKDIVSYQAVIYENEATPETAASSK